MIAGASIGGTGSLALPGPSDIGPLATRVGVTAAEAAAVKRHAAREESRGDHASALENWRVALWLTPGDTRCWDSVARCLRALGRDDEARAVARACDALRGGE